MIEIAGLALITPLQLALIAAFGLALGMAKMGLSGAAIVVIPVLATVFGARFTAGLVAPLLLVADTPAVIVYRGTRDWKLAVRTLAWILAGIGIGALVGERVPDSVFRLILALVLFSLVAIMVLMELRQRSIRLPGSPLVSGPIGVIAGFASMLGNAAGPIVSLYFLAKRLDKAHFLGTISMVFLVVNVVKLPLHIFYWQTITARTLLMDALAVPFILLGALAGRYLVRIIPERAFRSFIIVFVLMGAIRLLVG